MSQHRYYRHQTCRDVDRVTGAYPYRQAASSIRLVKSAVDDCIRLPMTNGYRRQIVSTDAAYLSVALGTSGPGGEHPSYPFNLMAGGMYAIYAAWRSSTAEHNGTLCLFGVPTGTQITPVVIAALDPVGARWDYWSLHPVAFWCNQNGSGAYDFMWSDGRYEHHTGGATYFTLGLNLAAVIETGIDLRNYVPQEADAVLLYVDAVNNQDTVRTVKLLRNDGSTSVAFWKATCSDGAPNRYKISQQDLIRCGLVGNPCDRQTVLRYIWDGAPNGGLNVYAAGFVAY